MASKKRRKITPEDLREFRLVSDPQVSPDGGTVVFVHKQADKPSTFRSELWTVSAAGGAPRRFTSSGTDSKPRWSPDGSRIAFVSSGRADGAQLFTISVAGGEATQLTRFPEGQIGGYAWAPDGTKLAVTFREQDPDWTKAAAKEREAEGASEPPRVLDDLWYRLDGDGYFNAQRFALYIVDAETGGHRKLFAKDTLGQFSFDWSPDSKQLVVAANLHRRALLEPFRTELFRVDARTGKLTKIVNLPEGPKTSPRWSPDGKRIAYAGRPGKDDLYSVENLELFVCDSTGGKARSLTKGQDHCLLAIGLDDLAEVEFAAKLSWARDGKRIYCSIGHEGRMHLCAVPSAGGKIEFLGAGPGNCFMGNQSRDGRTMAVLLGSPTRPPEVAVARTGTELVLDQLTSVNQALFRQLAIPKPKSHWIRGKDGTRIHCWSITPERKGKGPAVLSVHGGPHAMYGVGFFHEFHVMAAAGYAVYFANPRGSKGYGRDHCAAIRGNWGGPDWDDVQAVADFMAEQPTVDPERVGICGGSYGGYMTNWAIGHSNRFRAAITDRCVSNLVSFFGNTDCAELPGTYWDGNSWDRPEELWRQSPVQFFGNVKTPTLIIHSEGDLRCNIEQAEQVFTILKIRNVPCRFVRYPRSTSHGMSRGGPPDMRIHRLHQMLEWWRRWLG